MDIQNHNCQDEVSIEDLYAAEFLPPNLRRFSFAVKSIADEKGDFLLSYYGAQMALGFKGDLAFIRRCYNWAENSGVIGKGASLHWFYDEDGKMAYVCPPTKDHIRNGLIAQFRAEIIHNSDVIPIKKEWDDENGLTLEYDESQVESLAVQRADDFIANRIKPDSFMAYNPRNIGHIYNWNTQKEVEE